MPTCYRCEAGRMAGQSSGPHRRALLTVAGAEAVPPQSLTLGYGHVPVAPLPGACALICCTLMTTDAHAVWSQCHEREPIWFHVTSVDLHNGGRVFISTVAAVQGKTQELVYAV